MTGLWLSGRRESKRRLSDVPLMASRDCPGRHPAGVPGTKSTLTRHGGRDSYSASCNSAHCTTHAPRSSASSAGGGLCGSIVSRGLLTLAARPVIMPVNCCGSRTTQKAVRAIATMAADGLPVPTACRLLSVAQSSAWPSPGDFIARLADSDRVLGTVRPRAGLP
jgi:hypothetical protein